MLETNSLQDLQLKIGKADTIAFSSIIHSFVFINWSQLIKKMQS